MASTKSKAVTVDYPTVTPVESHEGALALARSKGKWYASQEAKAQQAADTRTAVAVQVTGEALKTGLLSDARGKDRPDYAISKQAFAAYFDVTSSQVTFWGDLAHVVSLGMTPGDALWKVLAGHNPKAKAKGVPTLLRKARSLSDVTKALRACGIDPDTGKSLGTDPSQGPRGVDGTGGNEGGREATPEVTPLQQARDALKVLVKALGSPTIQGDEWTELRAEMQRIVTAQDRKRGIGTKRTRKATATKAEAKATGTDG